MKFRVSDNAHQHRGIPSLDGLRALAVLAVILSHFNGWSSLPKTGELHTVMTLLGQGGLGVSVFFVISGLLITTLLLNEKDRNGEIAIGSFYLRRSFRIFPAFYVYLICAAIVASIAGRALPTGALATAAAYVSNYYPYAWVHPPLKAWYVAHTWSLSVEEQFYLLWPLLMSRLSTRHAIRFCYAVLLVTPVLRVVTLLALPVYAMSEQWARLFHTTADGLALGCLLAFLLREPRFVERTRLFFRAPFLLLAALYLAGSGALLTHAPQWFNALITISLTNLCIALLVLWVVLRPQTAAGTALNWQPLAHIGRISYSLYLWQQLFLGPYWVPSNGWNLLAIFTAAELSYWLVERPCLRLRDRWFPSAKSPSPALSAT